MPGHSSITITADTYTSLLPEADLAIAEAAAWLVPRACATSGNIAPEAEPDGAKKPGSEPVPDDADPLGDIRESSSPSAHAPLTQTAPDEESEAEQSTSLGEEPQVNGILSGAPGRMRTCDTRLRSFPWAGL
ncbi:hypothetical protein GCM10027073_52270 [Streptomyces chlorus]